MEYIRDISFLDNIRITKTSRGCRPHQKQRSKFLTKDELKDLLA